jgi:hypothetical protein
MPQGGRHYIPRPDNDALAWAQAFHAACKKHEGELPINSDDLDAIAKAVDTYAQGLSGAEAARALAAAATQRKDAARAGMEPLLRTYARRFKADPAVGEALELALGITYAERSPARNITPATRPLVTVSSSERLSHGLRLCDELTPTRAARPRGVHGAEVWSAVVDPRGAAPSDPAVYRYQRTVTRPKAEVAFPAEQGGKTACYLVRWVSATGEAGPWSFPAQATIAA